MSHEPLQVDGARGWVGRSTLSSRAASEGGSPVLTGAPQLDALQVVDHVVIVVVRLQVLPRGRRRWLLAQQLHGVAVVLLCRRDCHTLPAR